MDKFPKRIIIIGSGASVRQGLWDTEISEIPIWKTIKNEYTIGLNFSYKWFVPTVQMFVDYHFYMNLKKDLDLLPLIVGKEDPHIGIKKDDKGKLLCEIGKNLYLLPANKTEMVDGKKKKYWGLNSWEKGFYDPVLVGIFALTFAIACGFKEIYLLGFDCKDINKKTHFYQGDKEKTGYLKKEDRIKSGIGFTLNKKTNRYVYKTQVYDTDINDKFRVFEEELNKIKIINVSPESKIDIFPKIDYEEFYEILKEDERIILQSRAREEVRNLLETRLKEK